MWLYMIQPSFWWFVGFVGYFVGLEFATLEVSIASKATFMLHAEVNTQIHQRFIDALAVDPTLQRNVRGQFPEYFPCNQMYGCTCLIMSARWVCLGSLGIPKSTGFIIFCSQFFQQIDILGPRSSPDDLTIIYWIGGTQNKDEPGVYW